MPDDSGVFHGLTAEKNVALRVVVGGVVLGGVVLGGGRVAVISVVGEGTVVVTTGGRVIAAGEFAWTGSVTGRVVVGVEGEEPLASPEASASCASASGIRGSELSSAGET